MQIYVKVLIQPQIWRIGGSPAHRLGSGVLIRVLFQFVAEFLHHIFRNQASEIIYGDVLAHDKLKTSGQSVKEVAEVAVIFGYGDFNHLLWCPLGLGGFLYRGHPIKADSVKVNLVYGDYAPLGEGTPILSLYIVVGVRITPFIFGQRDCFPYLRANKAEIACADRVADCPIKFAESESHDVGAEERTEGFSKCVVHIFILFV